MKISGEKQVKFLTSLLKFAFSIQRHLTPIIEVNNKHLESTIYATWHGHQCCIFGLKEKTKTNVLISRSIDGQIIADAVKILGLKSVRGSKGKKGSVEATMQLIEKLKEKEDIVITVDGPSGPRGIVKKGVITVAKLSGSPIVPMIWYSPDISLISFPSWDKFLYPLGYTRLINIYGEPIYVEKDASPEEEENVRLQVENSFKELEKKAPEAWKKAWKGRLWVRNNEK